MSKCLWCEERLSKRQLFCDDLCERLYNDYWGTQKPWYANPEQDRLKAGAHYRSRQK